jgi:hypothetical protein
MQRDRKAIAKYLDEVNWNYREVAEREDIILTGYCCRIRFYDYAMPVEIKTTKHWILLRGYLHRHVPHSARASVLNLLSTLNGQTHQARYFLVEDCVVLQTEVPQLRCQAESFLEALACLCRHATRAGLEVAVLASNSSVARLYEEVSASNPVGGLPIEEDEDALLQLNLSANRLSM